MGYGTSALLQVHPTANPLQVLNTAKHVSLTTEIIIDLIGMQISLHAVNETLEWASISSRFQTTAAQHDT